jgi:hypothetical protein
MSAVIDASTISAMARDAGAFMQQLDLIQRRALFVRLAENDLRVASFLDERLGAQGHEGFWLPLDAVPALAAAATKKATPDFIFHIGHCGSTLLSRLLDQVPTVLGLREPLALRELAHCEHELDSPLARIGRNQWQALFAASLTLLGRGFSPGQRLIVKATSSCNNLIAHLLAPGAEARVLLLHIPLESYLATMAKAHGGGLDALHCAPARLRFLHKYLGEETPHLHELDPAEVIAMGWVAELLRFRAITVEQAGSNRVMSLDFEKFLVEPDRQLGMARQHFGLSMTAQDYPSVMQSPAMRSYAKSPAHAYSPTDRDHDLKLSRQRFAAEIRRGMLLVENLIRRHPQLESMLPLRG